LTAYIFVSVAIKVCNSEDHIHLMHLHAENVQKGQCADPCTLCIVDGPEPTRVRQSKVYPCGCSISIKWKLKLGKYAQHNESDLKVVITYAKRNLIPTARSLLGDAGLTLNVHACMKKVFLSTEFIDCP